MSKISVKSDYLYQMSLLSQTLYNSVSELCSKNCHVSLNQYRCLQAISLQRQTTARDISAHTDLDKMNVSRSVRALQTKQLIAVSTSGTDKRKKLISITPAGGEKLLEFSPVIEKLEKQLLSKLNQSEIQALDSIILAFKTIA